jgi:hypothetical protein
VESVICLQVLLSERLLLQTLAFDLTVEHPYKYLLSYVKTLKGNQANDTFKHLAQVRPPASFSTTNSRSILSLLSLLTGARHRWHGIL